MGKGENEMDLKDVREKEKRKNQILFSRDSSCLQELLQLIRLQKHRTIVMWVFECVRIPVQILKDRYPNEKRPETAVRLCIEWSKGNVKMPVAKRALLQAHAVAKELTNPADIALCHAVGQACATVHVETHAIGLVIYELTAIVREYGIDHCEKKIEDKIAEYIFCLKSCATNIDTEPFEWADFLLDDSRPNKEQQLLERKS
jgi:hypothetical protein